MISSLSSVPVISLSGDVIIILFPLLEFSGFDATANEQAKQSLIMLTILYAICPLFLKLVAILILIKTPLQDD